MLKQRPRGVNLEHVQAVQEHLRRLSPFMIQQFDYNQLPTGPREAYVSLLSLASGEQLKFVSKLLDLREHVRDQIRNVAEARARRERLLKITSGLAGEQRQVTDALSSLRSELDKDEDKIHQMADRLEAAGLSKDEALKADVKAKQKEILRKVEIYKKHVERHREKHGEEVHQFCNELLGEMDDKRRYYETRIKLIRLAHEVNEIQKALRPRRR